MDDVAAVAERPGLFTRVYEFFRRNPDVEEPEDGFVPRPLPRVQPGRVQITVRRQITSFNDAIAAADGLKRGEQQILNLSACDAVLRETIKNFMHGVNYGQDGTLEELGDNVFLLAPQWASVDVVPASPRVAASWN
jgi:cell division inhibitor SepF